MSKCFARAAADRLGQVIKLDLAARGNNNRSLDGILQLADIARPVVIDQRPHCFFGNSGNKTP